MCAGGGAVALDAGLASELAVVDQDHGGCPWNAVMMAMAVAMMVVVIRDDDGGGGDEQCLSPHSFIRWRARSTPRRLFVAPARLGAVRVCTGL